MTTSRSAQLTCQCGATRTVIANPIPGGDLTVPQGGWSIPLSAMGQRHLGHTVMAELGGPYVGIREETP